jgi:hypothetical protein
MGVKSQVEGRSKPKLGPELGPETFREWKDQ